MKSGTENVKHCVLLNILEYQIMKLVRRLFELTTVCL